MKLNYRKYLTIIFLLIGMHSSYSQSNNQNQEKANIKKEYLKGLTKASKKKLKGKEIALDESIAVYNVEGKRISGYEISIAINSGDYQIDFYTNENKEVKVAVLRFREEQEKKLKFREEAASKEFNHKHELDTLDDINEPYIFDTTEFIGKKAAQFSAIDMAGNEYKLENLKGKVIVINFWFIQCAPCIKEIPELNELIEKYKQEDNVVFLAFALNKKEEIESFLKKTPFLYNIIPDGKIIIDDYNVTSFPTNMVINQDSKIVEFFPGYMSNFVEVIDNTIQNLIKK